MKAKTVDMAPFAIITGGSQGIGRALARECARRGHNVAVVALDDEALAHTGARLRHDFPAVQVETLGLDLTLPDAGRRLVAWIQERELSVNMLINNAGIGFQGYFADARPEEHELMINLNVLSTLRLTYALLPMLAGQPKAYVLNVSSMAALHPMPFKTVYAATKAFVRSFSLGLRGEYYGSNIQVSVLTPGPVATNEAVLERIARQPKLIRQTTFKPEEVARMAIDGLMAGKAEIIPGLMQRLYKRIFLWLAPPELIQWLIRRTLQRRA